MEELKGWNNPQLRATTADEAPKHTTINVFPRAADAEVCSSLEMLDHQNEDLRISSWKVVKEHAEGTAKRLIIGVAEQSVEAMRKQDWKLSYRYGTVRAASHLLANKFISENFGVMLLQEPCINQGKICGLSTPKPELVYDVRDERPRACILINRKLTYTTITEFLSMDLVAVEVRSETKPVFSVVLARHAAIKDPYRRI